MEITSNARQEVNVGNNVLFTETPIPGSCSIVHREGSGLVTLRGLTGQARARFRVFFGANIAIPTGTTVSGVTQSALALSISGEPINTTTMIASSSAVETYYNVASSIFIDVPTNCCMTISVENVGNQPVAVQNANLIVERVA